MRVDLGCYVRWSLPLNADPLNALLWGYDADYSDTLLSTINIIFFCIMNKYYLKYSYIYKFDTYNNNQINNINIFLIVIIYFFLSVYLIIIFFTQYIYYYLYI